MSFAYPGGVVQSKALLERPALATLRARVSELVRAARARGWRPPPSVSEDDGSQPEPEPALSGAPS